MALIDVAMVAVLVRSNGIALRQALACLRVLLSHAHRIKDAQLMNASWVISFCAWLPRRIIAASSKYPAFPRVRIYVALYAMYGRSAALEAFMS